LTEKKKKKKKKKNSKTPEQQDLKDLLLNKAPLLDEQHLRCVLVAINRMIRGTLIII